MIATGLCLLSLFSPPPPLAVPPAEIAWHAGDFRSATVAATRAKQDVLIYFWSETSQTCIGFFQNQLQDPRVVDATGSFVCLGAQLESPAGRALFERYEISTTPSLVVIDPGDESAQDAIFGSANIPTVVHHLGRIARDEDTLRDLEQRVEKTPDELELRGQLAGRLESLGHADRAEALRAGIRADDPEGRSDVAALMYLQEHLRASLQPARSLTPELVAQLSEYVAELEAPGARHRGWNEVANLHNALADLDAEFAALQRAYADVRDLQVFNWGWSNVLWWWSNRDVLSKDQRRFVLEVARRTAEVSERLSEEDPAYYDPGLFLTRRLHVLAMALHMNGERDEAKQIMRRCVELYPVNGEYRARLAAYEAGQDDGYFNSYSDYDASWSPDGRHVVFTSTRDGNPELYVADIKRGGSERVTRCLGADDHARYGPKGKELVFRSTRFKTAAIYSSEPDGEELRLVVPLDDGSGRPIPSGAASYSKDKKAVALIRMDAGVPRAMLADTRSGEFSPVTRDTEGEDSLSWAGRRLVYSSARDGKRDIFLADADGSEERNLTPAEDDSWDIDASASKDGKRIVFASWRDGRCNIWSVDVDGSNLTRLTDTAAQDRRPRLAPDGKSIVFDRSDDSGASRLFWMKADGSGAKPLLEQGS